MHIHSKLIQQFCKMFLFFFFSFFMYLVLYFFYCYFQSIGQCCLWNAIPFFFSWSTTILNALCMASLLFCFNIFLLTLRMLKNEINNFCLFFLFPTLWILDWISSEMWFGLHFKVHILIPFDFWTLGSLWVQFRQLLDFQIFRAFTKPVDVL